jgi:hypothetical protein
MRLSSAKKGTLAIAATLSLVLLSAPPASASTVAVTITSGTLTAAGNTFDLAPGGGNPPPCSAKSGTLSLTTNFGGTASLTGAWSTMFQLGAPPQGQFYQADFTILTGAMTWATVTSGPPVWTYAVASSAPNHIIFQARIYRIASGSCAKTDLGCIITVKVNSIGDLESYTALPTYTPGSIMLNVSSVAPHMSVLSCSAPFVSWAGQTVTGSITLT